jgi:hypothetical protein
MTTKTNSTKVIHRVVIMDSNGIGKIPRTFNAKDSIRPCTSGVQGLRPSTVGLAARNTTGTQGQSAGTRQAKNTVEKGFKTSQNGAAGNRVAEKTPSAAEIDKIKKSAFEQGVRAYNEGRVRDQQEEAKRAMESWVKDRIDSRAMDDAGMRELLGSK